MTVVNAIFVCLALMLAVGIMIVACVFSDGRLND